MTLPSSGPISFDNLKTEFGDTYPIRLNEFYSGSTLVPSSTGFIPASGAISLNQFYTSAYPQTLWKVLDNPVSTGSENSRFGNSVDTSGNYVIIGAYFTQFKYGADPSNVYQYSGLAHIYDSTTGLLLRTLANPNTLGTQKEDQFGCSVAVSGDYAIVGAYGEGTTAGSSAGSAYIYNVVTGTLLHSLNDPNAYGTPSWPLDGNVPFPPGDSFGYTVDISGNYAAVGAPYESDAGGKYSGKVYVFNVVTGALLYTMNNPNAHGVSAGDRFGFDLAISGNYLIVGAPSETETLPSGTPGGDSGKAYVFDVATGTKLYTLNNPNASGLAMYDSFGASVSVSGSYAVVGAWGDVGTNVAGTVYIFNVATGTLLWTLSDPNAYGSVTGDAFGYELASSGIYLVVGTWCEGDAGGSASGKAYIFNAQTGTLLKTLNNPNAYGTSAADFFGHSVAISGTCCVVGAYAEDSSSASSAGKAYIYK